MSLASAMVVFGTIGLFVRNIAMPSSVIAFIRGAVGTAFLVVFCLVVLFCGNITYDFRDDSVVIDSEFYSAYTLRYDAIDDIQFREGNVPGVRVGGYGSLRLLMGWFENEELGTHVRYTYYKPGAGVVVQSGNTTLVLSGKDAAETRALYETLLSKTEK